MTTVQSIIYEAPEEDIGDVETVEVNPNEYIQLLTQQENQNENPAEDQIKCPSLEDKIYFPEDIIETDLDNKLEMTPSGELLRRYIKWEGIGDHHINVYDRWLCNTAFINVYSKMLILKEDKVVVFENLRIVKPRYTRDGKVLDLTPKLAREQGVTYGCDWHIDVVLREGSYNGRELDRRNGICIGTIPLMLKSSNCILHGKTPEELAILGEDPNDPGGYFIVEGGEKVILLQEQLAVNKIYLMNMDPKGSTVARMTANTPSGTALIELALDRKTKSIMKIRCPSMRGPPTGSKKDKRYGSINVLRLFRIFGISDVEQIKQIISRFMKPDRVKKSILKLTRNIVDFTIMDDDINIIAAKVDMKDATPEEKQQKVIKILETDLFPHLNFLPGPDNETIEERQSRIAKAKIYLLAIMIARFLEHLAGYRPLDDRDSWSNKRVEGAGRMMEQLFRNAWRKTLMYVQTAVDQNNVKNLAGVVEKIRSSIVTDTFRDSFITNVWGVKGQTQNQTKSGVVQMLLHDSLLAMYSQINTVDVRISRTDRQLGLRLVQDSQWGFICPVSTPEGENAGILKNLAVTAKVSLECSDTEIIRHLIGDPDRGLPALVRMDYPKTGGPSDKIIANGKFMGWCDGEYVKSYLINLRRKGELPYDMSVIKEDDWVYVDIGPSRLVRPLLIVDENQELVLDKLNLRESDNYTLLKSGALEYISAWEQEYIKIATTVEEIENRKQMIASAEKFYRDAESYVERIRNGETIYIESENQMVPLTREEAENRLASAEESLIRAQSNKPYTHCEIDPQTILGIAAALIPWPNHNQAPRNTYQVAMGKQSLGTYHLNHTNRMTDGKTKILAFPSRPLVETDMYNTVGMDKRGPGENTTIAFMAYPYTEEDSFVFKKEFLDRGGFRMYKYLVYTTTVRGSGEVIEKLEKPEPREGDTPGRYNYIQPRTGDDDPFAGLPKIGAPMRQGDCVIGKLQYVSVTKERRNESVFLRVGDEGVVDKVLVTSDNKTMVVKVKLRIMRVPQEGDKFAPRNAQKGTIGLVMSDVDLPYTEDGISPDIIVNSHCFASDTPILLKNGMSRPLTSMAYDGGEKVWSFDIDKQEFIESHSVGFEHKGKQELIKLVLSDGRIIRCTPDHKIPVIQYIGDIPIHKIVKFKEIDETMKFYAGIEGILDNPTQEERFHENNWSLGSGKYLLDMKENDSRDKALAFARLLGLICSDGCVCMSKDRYCGNIVIGTYLDANTVLDDIYLLTGKRPAITSNTSKKGGTTLTIMLPADLCEFLASIEGMTIGKRTIQKQQWPQFLFEDKCPKSIVREFLGGLFGGDGWSPMLTTNKQDGQGTVTFTPPAFSQSASSIFKKELKIKIMAINDLLVKVGVRKGRIENRANYMGQDGILKCNFKLQLHRGTDFGNKVGYRYCVQKMYRLAAYQSYMRYLENVKRQNDFIVSRSSELYDSRLVKSLNEGLIRAREELFATEIQFNAYYSNATLDQVRNRRRKERLNELTKWDYSKIEDADAYLRKINAYHWFRTSEGTGGADYIIKREDQSMPYFMLGFHQKVTLPAEDVYDIGIDITHTLNTVGIAVKQCLPSRMTISYPMELLTGKHCAFRGVHYNGGPFKPFRLNEMRQTMKDYGKHEFGYEKMRSGTSGKYLEALIFSGPVYFQALRHHVKDKIQSRSTGQVKPMTRQPPKGRGNKGGLRFGEMERDAVISHGGSSFLRERLMLVSDAYQTAFCKTCGTFAVYDSLIKSYKTCRLCGDNKNFGRCTIPYAYKLLNQLLAATGINLRLEFVTQEEYLDKILRAEAKFTASLEDINSQLLASDIAGAYAEDMPEEETNYADIFD